MAGEKVPAAAFGQVTESAAAAKTFEKTITELGEKLGEHVSRLRTLQNGLTACAAGYRRTDAQVAAKPALEHAIGKRAIRREAVALADLHAQRETEPAHVADLRVPALEVAEKREEAATFFQDARRIVRFGEDPHHLEASRRAERIRRKRRMGGARTELCRVDELLARPDAR